MCTGCRGHDPHSVVHTHGAGETGQESSLTSRELYYLCVVCTISTLLLYCIANAKLESTNMFGSNSLCTQSNSCAEFRLLVQVVAQRPRSAVR